MMFSFHVRSLGLASLLDANYALTSTLDDGTAAWKTCLLA